MNPCGCTSSFYYSIKLGEYECAKCGYKWPSVNAQLNLWSATSCTHAVRSHDQFGTATCVQCGKVLTSKPANPDDYCKDCGAKLVEVLLFTSKSKYCKVCEDRAKADKQLDAALEDMFDNEITQVDPFKKL